MEGAEVQLADVLEELQAVHAEMSALATHSDALLICAVVALAAGVCLGLVVVVCFQRWFD